MSTLFPLHNRKRSINTKTNFHPATDRGEAPTARAITERLAKIRTFARKTGSTPSGNSAAKAKGPGRLPASIGPTPRKAVEPVTPRKNPATDAVKKALTIKKRKVKKESVGDESDIDIQRVSGREVRDLENAPIRMPYAGLRPAVSSPRTSLGEGHGFGIITSHDDNHDEDDRAPTSDSLAGEGDDTASQSRQSHTESQLKQAMAVVNDNQHVLNTYLEDPFKGSVDLNDAYFASGSGYPPYGAGLGPMRHIRPAASMSNAYDSNNAWASHNQSYGHRNEAEYGGWPSSAGYTAGNACRQPGLAFMGCATSTSKIGMCRHSRPEDNDNSASSIISRLSVDSSPEVEHRCSNTGGSRSITAPANDSAMSTGSPEIERRRTNTTAYRSVTVEKNKNGYSTGSPRARPAPRAASRGVQEYIKHEQELNGSDDSSEHESDHSNYEAEEDEDAYA